MEVKAGHSKHPLLAVSRQRALVKKRRLNLKLAEHHQRKHLENVTRVTENEMRHRATCTALLTGLSKKETQLSWWLLNS